MNPDPCTACGRPLVAAKSRRTGLCAGCHAEHAAAPPRSLRPLDPDTFPEDMRPVVRWHLLLTRADALTERTGLGLASVWGHVKHGHYAEALAELDRIESATASTSPAATSPAPASRTETGPPMSVTPLAFIRPAPRTRPRKGR